MEISIKKTKKDFAFIADNDEVKILLCAGPQLEEGNTGFRPMQMILASLGGCMSIDIMMILKKQRQEVHTYEVKVKGDRVDDTPKVFHHIIIEVHVTGKVKEEKLKQAIKLSEEKYCSVHHMLNKAVKIETKYFLNQN